MRRTHRRMSLPVKIITWFIGILVVLAIVASIFVVASIFITSGKIHNPLNRQHSELRSKNVSLSNGDPFTIALFGVDSNAQRKSENDGERSDTIIFFLLTLRNKLQKL